MIRGLSRRTAWLLAVAGFFAVAVVVDNLLPGDPPAVAKKATAKAKASSPTPAPKSTAELHQRLQHMRSLAHSSREVNDAYAKVALPYAEAMAPLATWFAPGSDPKAVLERAVRQLAADAGVEVDGLVVSAPQRVAAGVYRGVATLSLRASDSGGMLRFLSEAGRPGGGMVWNGFQLSADAQKKQLALAGELHVLLVEAAE